jgi:hypothetical protein
MTGQVHRCTCGAPYIPTAEHPDYCDFCVTYPEYRIPRIRAIVIIQKHERDLAIKAMRAREYRRQRGKEINAMRRESRRRKKIQAAA